MSNRIAIVNSSSFGKIFPQHLERLEKLGEVTRITVDNEISGKDLAKKLYGYNIIVASVVPFYTEEFFENKDETKLISRHGIGYNNIDLKAAERHNTLVSIVPALIERNAVAEMNVTNLLNVMRRVHESYEEVLDDNWEKRAQFVGHGLTNKTVGVIGVGNTGSKVVEILNYGFQCEVLGYDPNKSEIEIEQFGAKKVELNELLGKVEAICLCASLNNDSYHMISTEEFAKMRDNIYLSNSARGALIDEEAMIEALKNEKVAGFATDVLEDEPGRSTHPYLNYSNVIMTPHTAAYTFECLEGMGEKCVTDCEKIVSGKLPERSVQSISKYVN